ncbi:MAG: hypothetical protein WCI20_10160, partial [bacterium]
TSFVPGLWDAITLVIANDVPQFHVIEESTLVSSTFPVVFVDPDTGIAPDPIHPVARQFTPVTTTA